MESGKARENRLRRMAARLDLQLVKDRARTWGVHHQGQYRIVDPNLNACLAGSDYDLSLDEVETYLQETEASLRAAKA